MFCDQCGAPLQPQFRFCSKCGKTILGTVATVQPTFQQARFERRLQLLGTLWMIAGALWLLPSLALMTFGDAVGFTMAPFSPFRHVLFPPLMLGFGAGLFLLAAAGLCIGWGILHREHWARTAAVAVAIPALFHAPFGTALGAYTLWALISDQAGPMYNQISRVP